MSARPVLHLVAPPSPSQLAAAKQREAHAQALVAFDDAISILAEGTIRAAEVVRACGPAVIGVGRHARLSQLARHVAIELAQIGSLPRQ